MQRPRSSVGTSDGNKKKQSRLELVKIRGWALAAPASTLCNSTLGPNNASSTAPFRRSQPPPLFTCWGGVPGAPAEGRAGGTFLRDMASLEPKTNKPIESHLSKAIGW